MWFDLTTLCCHLEVEKNCEKVTPLTSRTIYQYNLGHADTSEYKFKPQVMLQRYFETTSDLNPTKSAKQFSL